MGPGQKFLAPFGQSQIFVAQPSLVWGWAWKISPKNIKFSFCLLPGKRNLI